ncbi:MFS transporter [Patulibacter minatonensis]|uniref:MFS transporter n=1 Tax=Patulibacter minatonensis TaxID=298163 RepID=UPI0012FC248B|nr:MFS transporter [Patulibacter minatonensis]
MTRTATTSPTGFTGRERVALAILCAAVFVINVSTTIVNITLPRLTEDLGASTEDLLWIVDAFNLVFAALVLAGGSLSDRYGRKRALVVGLALFAVASFGGATAGSPDALIAWRAAAGVGAALIFPVTLSILSNLFTDRRRRAKAIGIWGATTGLAIAAGPVVGGFLVEHVSWNSTLVFPGAVAVLALLGTVWRIPESRDPATPPPDVGGIALSTLGLGLLVYTLIEAPAHGWTSTATLGGLAGAVLVLVVFTLWERAHEHPMLDVRIFTNLRFTAASASITFAFFAMFGFIFLVTQYFQFVKDYGPFESGLRILPFALCVGITSIVGSRLAVAVGTKLVVAGGLGLLAAGFAWTSTASGTTDYLVIAGQMVLMGSGLGLTSAPATEAIMGVVPAEKAGVGSAVNDATRELGGTLGVAVIGSVSLSLYREAFEGDRLPAAVLEPARESIGSALGAAARLAASGDGGPASALVVRARGGYLDGLQAGCGGGGRRRAGRGGDRGAVAAGAPGGGARGR